MNLLLWMLLLGGGGYVAYEYVIKPHSKMLEGPSGYGTKELLPGKTYTVQLVVNPRSIENLGQNNPSEKTDKMSSLIKATFEQLGFKIAAPPVAQDPNEFIKFQQLNPSTWVFTGLWNRQDKIVGPTPDWVVSITPFQVPTL